MTPAPWGYGNGNLPSLLPQQFESQFYPLMSPWAMAVHMQAFNPINMSRTPASQQQIQQGNPMAAQNTVEAWCHAYGLGSEECQSLTKLDFKVGDKLDS
jgi:hypothetical protein